jgi:hypothetical protein
MRGLLAMLLLPGCVVADHDDGITVSLALVHHFHNNPGANPEGAPRTFTNGQGDEITLTRGYLIVYAAELRACDGAHPSITHTLGQPTLLEIRSGDDLMRADTRPLDLGVLAPPPGDYCAVRLTLAPADGDLGLPADVAGKTLLLEGSYLPPGGGSATPFTIVSTTTVSVDVPFRDGAGNDVTLVLGDAQLTTEVTFATAYDEWFDGIDLGWTLPDQLDERVMANVATSVHQHAAATSLP